MFLVEWDLAFERGFHRQVLLSEASTVAVCPFSQILRKFIFGSLFYPMVALKVSFCVWKASHWNILTCWNFKRGLTSWQINALCAKGT